MGWFLNGIEMTETEFNAAIAEQQTLMALAEQDVMEQNPGISQECASSIVYLRSRSRWTLAKEEALIAMSRAGYKLPNVFAGEF